LFIKKEQQSSHQSYNDNGTEKRYRSLESLSERFYPADER